MCFNLFDMLKHVEAAKKSQPCRERDYRIACIRKLQVCPGYQWFGFLFCLVLEVEVTTAGLVHSSSRGRSRHIW